MIGELLALQWRNVNLEMAIMNIAFSGLQDTRFSDDNWTLSACLSAM